MKENNTYKKVQCIFLHQICNYLRVEKKLKRPLDSIEILEIQY
jgi:hypothetical protein